MSSSEFSFSLWVLTLAFSRVTVAGKPSDDLASGTLNSILKQSGLKK